MARKIILQTVKDFEPENVLKKAPFHCNNEKAWLGDGYYFWDTFEELAHWWGESQHKGKYIICRAECDFERSKCLDLHGEPEDMNFVRSIYKMLREDDLIDDEFTLSELITYLRMQGLFEYEAVRMTGILSLSKNSWNKYSFTIKVEKGKPYFIDGLPPIQICFYDKRCMNMKGMEIIHPDKYVA